MLIWTNSDKLTEKQLCHLMQMSTQLVWFRISNILRPKSLARTLQNINICQFVFCHSISCLSFSANDAKLLTCCKTESQFKVLTNVFILLQSFKFSIWVIFFVLIRLSCRDKSLLLKPPSAHVLRQEEMTAGWWSGAARWRWILNWLVCERLSSSQSAQNTSFCHCVLSICPFGTLSPGLLPSTLFRRIVCDSFAFSVVWGFYGRYGSWGVLNWLGMPLVNCNACVPVANITPAEVSSGQNDELLSAAVTLQSTEQNSCSWSESPCSDLYEVATLF